MQFVSYLALVTVFVASLSHVSKARAIVGDNKNVDGSGSLRSNKFCTALCDPVNEYCDEHAGQCGRCKDICDGSITSRHVCRTKCPSYLTATTLMTLSPTPMTPSTTPMTLSTTPMTLSTTPMTLSTTPMPFLTTPMTLSTTPMTLSTTPMTHSTEDRDNIIGIVFGVVISVTAISIVAIVCAVCRRKRIRDAEQGRLDSTNMTLLEPTSTNASAQTQARVSTYRYLICSVVTQCNGASTGTGLTCAIPTEQATVQPNTPSTPPCPSGSARPQNGCSATGVHGIYTETTNSSESRKQYVNDAGNSFNRTPPQNNVLSTEVASHRQVSGPSDTPDDETLTKGLAPSFAGR